MALHELELQVWFSIAASGQVLRTTPFSFIFIEMCFPSQRTNIWLNTNATGLLHYVVVGFVFITAALVLTNAT